MSDTTHRETELSREEVWSLILLEKDGKVEAHQLAGPRRIKCDVIEIAGQQYRLTTDVLPLFDRHDLHADNKATIEDAIKSFQSKTQSPNTNGGIFWAESVKSSE